MIEIIEHPRNEAGAVLYDILINGDLKHAGLYYDAALEQAAILGQSNQTIKIVYVDGKTVDFEPELAAKRKMDARGW